jgi:hypothetical protein
VPDVAPLCDQLAIQFRKLHPDDRGLNAKFSQASWSFDGNSQLIIRQSVRIGQPIMSWFISSFWQGAIRTRHSVSDPMRDSVRTFNPFLYSILALLLFLLVVPFMILIQVGQAVDVSTDE